MTTKCYFNGDFLPFEDIHLHASDLQLQRGYGIFDFFRSRGGDIPWLEDYIDRIFRSLDLAEIDSSLDRQEFRGIIRRLHEANGLENGAFKVIITGGYSDTLESVTGKPNILVLHRPYKAPPEKHFSEGVKLVSCEYQRQMPEIKTLNYFTTMQLRKKFRKYDAVDVLYHKELVSEASRANLFFVKGGRVSTPCKNILKGITRKQVLNMFSEINEEDIPTETLYDFDEIFLASTSRDIAPVVFIEGRKIGNGKPGPLSLEVMAAFRAKGW